MQREIKFRLWDTNIKTMFTWKQILLRWNSFSILTCPYLIPMQYTGLKDKNGKEIYAGDIVRAENGEVFIVKYGEHATSEWNDNWEIGFYVESTSEEEISRGIRTDIVFWVKYRALEVIGNIHDNPELLQEVE